MLPEDDNADRLERAVRAEDYGEAFRCAHTIKGLAATLELGPLLETAVCLTEEPVSYTHLSQETLADQSNPLFADVRDGKCFVGAGTYEVSYLSLIHI